MVGIEHWKNSQPKAVLRQAAHSATVASLGTPIPRSMKGWTQATAEEIRRAHSIELVDPGTGQRRRIGSDQATFTGRGQPARVVSGELLTLSADEADFDQAEAHIRDVRRRSA